MVGMHNPVKDLLFFFTGVFQPSVWFANFPPTGEGLDGRGYAGTALCLAAKDAIG